MKNPFLKFEKFGAICDFETRRRIALTIFKELTSDSDEFESNFNLTSEETENYAASIEIVLSNKTLRQMTRNNPELAEKTTLEILNFIHNTRRKIVGLGNPWREEVMLADGFAVTEPNQHKDYWKIIRDFLKETYDKKEISPDFYTRAFNKFFKHDTDNGQFQSYESIRDHLMEKWRELILFKLVDFQEKTMQDLLEEFTKDLFARMEMRKEMAERMHDFATDFNEIFDKPQHALSDNELKALKKYQDLLNMNKTVKELVAMLGRMKLSDEVQEKGTYGTSKDKMEWQANHAGKADLIGVRESDDLSSMLPGETALLSDPVLQPLFFKKFTEKKLQTFEFEDRFKAFKADPRKKGNRQGKENEKGPYIICVDTSGSMKGQPELFAKTLCFAMLKIALKEKRNCFLITFSVGVATLDLSDLKNNAEKIVDFLSLSFHGGTDASPALAEAAAMLQTENFRNADVLMISDFEMPAIQASVQANMLQAKDAGTKFHSIVIGGYSWVYGNGYENHKVTAVFDHVWNFQPGDEKGIFKLVRKFGNA